MTVLSIRQALELYRIDPSVLDEQPDYTPFSGEFFFKGNSVGCIVLHGIAGTPANVRVVAERLKKDGYTVLAPVVAGHRSTVRSLMQTTAEDWADSVTGFYDRLVAEGCTKIFCIGLSLGGLLSIDLAERKPLEGLVPICAPIRMKPFLLFANAIRHVYSVVRYPPREDANEYTEMGIGLATRSVHEIKRESEHIRKHLDAITCPTLWISARFDNKVEPVSEAIFHRGAVNAKSYNTIEMENSPHGCTYGPERDAVAEHVAAFVRHTLENA